ncbi:unnamed protein product [Ceratitis capitata]|uniref:(Mediterranean fruit fly) hypothetical protein n=1 Tax=Ceratitis capitata TaxID=7213 RepID=A0A811V2M9_CERCA|nr:unnamed protein product [Ceratitis capitata]
MTKRQKQQNSKPNKFPQTNGCRDCSEKERDDGSALWAFVTLLETVAVAGLAARLRWLLAGLAGRLVDWSIRNFSRFADYYQRPNK